MVIDAGIRRVQSPLTREQRLEMRILIDETKYGETERKSKAVMLQEHIKSM